MLLDVTYGFIVIARDAVFNRRQIFKPSENILFALTICSHLPGRRQTGLVAERHWAAAEKSGKASSSRREVMLK